MMCHVALILFQFIPDGYKMGAPTPGYHVIALPPRRMLPKAFFLGIFLSYKWKPPVMDFTLRIFGQNCAHLKTILEEEEGPCFFSVIKASLLPSRRMERTVCWVNFKRHLPYLLHMLPSLPTFFSHALSVASASELCFLLEVMIPNTLEVLKG